jgi:DNA-binding CsgD family transcriptional regulator
MDDISSLSNMEHQAVRCTCEGLTNAEIGERLGVSAHTAKSYLMNAYEKLGVAHHTGARTKAAVMLVAHDMGTHAGRLLRNE